MEIKESTILQANQDMRMDSYNKINNQANYNKIPKGAILYVTKVEDSLGDLCIWYKGDPSHKSSTYFIAKLGTIKRRFNII